MPVTVRPISGSDVPAVAEFLHESLNRRVPAGAWARALEVPWSVDAPNYGFLLADGDTVVGAYLAFYSDRIIDGRREPFCNLGAWCVKPEHRVGGLRLLKALVAQEGYHFTDLSPSGNVVGINTRLGFQFLDTSTVLVPGLPWPSLPGRHRITADPAQIERHVAGAELERYRDHVHAAAAHHALLLRGDEWCYVVFRKDRRKNVPAFASILHVSNPGLFAAMARPFARWLLVHHRVLATLAELRVVRQRPTPSVRLRSARPKMFKSPRLAPEQIDYLYSELVCVAW